MSDPRHDPPALLRDPAWQRQEDHWHRASSIRTLVDGEPPQPVYVAPAWVGWVLLAVLLAVDSVLSFAAGWVARGGGG